MFRSEIGSLKERLAPKIRGFHPKTATNKQKGNYGEIISSDHLLHTQSLKDEGYDLISIGRDAPSSIDDKIVHGIDGLYENTNPNSNIVCNRRSEVWEFTIRKTAIDGSQMSDDWLVGAKTDKSRILKAVNKDKKLAIKISTALKMKKLERVLSMVDADGKVRTFKLDAKGNKIGERP